MKKTNSTSYQKTTLRLRKISGNENKKPEKNIYTPPNEQPEPANDSPNTNSQTENIPLVCNNIQDQNSLQRRLIHDDNNFPRNLRPNQVQDPILRNIKLKILKESYDNQLLNEDSRAAKYLDQEDRIIIKAGLLYRQFFGDTGKIKYLQVLLPN